VQFVDDAQAPPQSFQTPNIIQKPPIYTPSTCASRPEFSSVCEETAVNQGKEMLLCTVYYFVVPMFSVAFIYFTTISF
jgi:hypothetical protein